jgi:outer membrane protein TolC
MKGWPFILGIGLSGICILSGCAHFQSEPISPEKTAARLESRQLDDAGLKVFLEQNLGRKLKDWPQTNWDFNSLTLVAFYFHPDLEVARAQWLVAQAGTETAKARPNPSVSVNPGYDTQIPGNYSPWVVPVTFDLPIETAGKRGKRMAEAEKVAESARWNFVSAAWQVRRDVRTSLLDLKIAGQRVELLEQQFSIQKRVLKLLQQRLEAGEISRSDLTITQIALNQVQLDLSDARLTESEARSRLAAALGLSEAALNHEKFAFDFQMPLPGELTTTGARQAALHSRADILAALADYAAAEDDLRLEVAKQYPDLHLGPGYAWNSGQAGDSQWSLGVTLELPILDQNQGPIAEAEARRKLTAAKFTQLQAQVINAIDHAVSDVRLTREQLKTGNELFAAQQQQQKTAQAEFAAGAAEQSDVLGAQLVSVNASLGQLDHEAKWQAAVGALEDALQRPADSIAVVIGKMAAQNPDGKEISP